ncbi:tRNA lysidine(34) synthetase TilS [uncultured Neptuniibacter sp.]|uniref:tRNA lysidine(34) synthetase TilS n=1 Tax=uncultured Neptuniibacter sp. TaxID=502143 RepID=UPI002622458A|nr:tRNA lysidine(34) synthetase TilS [uncultured Neptuniibacter sp.]
MRHNPASATAIEQCERHFLALTSDFLASFPKKTVKRWLVAHSGGLDSQFLLHLAVNLLPKQQVVVIHVNHNLQPEAAAWAKFSRQQAETNGLSFILRDVTPEKNSEEAARRVRYEAFESVMESGDVLLLGHHLDDQAETLLFRFLRGSGIAGLQGIPVSRKLGKGYLLRPLLTCPRKMLEKSVTGLQLNHIHDPSNAALDYDRNFLRLSVLPLIKERWPNVARQWQSSAEIMRSTTALLEDYLDGDLRLCSPSRDRFEIAAWRALPLTRQDELLRHWIYRTLEMRVNQMQLSEIKRSVIDAGDSASPLYQLSEVELRRFNDVLYLVRPHIMHTSELLLNGDEVGVTSLGDGVLEFIRKGCSQEIKGELKIVRRKGGERCHPVGCTGSSTVKKILQEAKVPPWQRSNWPLLFHDEKLVAIPGICTSEDGSAEKLGFSLLWRPFSLSDSA